MLSPGQIADIPNLMCSKLQGGRTTTEDVDQGSLDEEEAAATRGGIERRKCTKSKTVKLEGIFR
jgi:hypothetical protein